MSSVLSLLPPDGWQRLLCDALWQSTLIGAVGWLIARFLVRHAAARSWLLLLTVTGCLLAPLASMVVRQNGIALFDRATQEVAATEPSTIPTLPAPSTFADSDTVQIDESQFIGPLKATDSTDPEADSSPSPARVRPVVTAAVPKTSTSKPAADLPLNQFSFFDWLRFVWLAASGLLIVRLAIGCVAVWRLIREAQPCNDAALQRAVDAARAQLALESRPTLLVSSHITTPMILAIGRPRLLIPRTDGGIDWTPAFTHELAHVARGDGWSRLWIELATVALPLSPVVWLLRRSFRLACEEACDDWVVATGTEPADYAGALTTWINRPCRIAPLPAIGMSITKWRIAAAIVFARKAGC